MRAKTKDRLLAIVGILMVILVLNGVGVLGTPIPWLQLLGLKAVTPTPTPITVTRGLVTTKAAGYDSLDIATTRAVGTDVNVYWYANRGGQWVLLGSGDSADINVEERDNNVIYGVASVPSAKAFYLDYSKVLSMNTRAQSVEFKDIDGDNVKEYVFRLNIADIPYASATGKYTMPSFNMYLLTYDGSASLSDLANATVGTAKVTKYFEWYVTLAAEKKAVAVSKVVLSVGTADITKFALKKVNVPGIGYLDGSSFEQSVLSSEIKWTYTVSSLLYGANYIKLPVNTLNKFDFTTVFEVDYETGDDIKITLTIYYLDNTGSQKSLTDNFYLAQA